LAKEFGVSPATVHRIWKARGLKPHLVETFKLSNDLAFEEKLTDAVGLYLNPPEQAIVLCVDEKSQVQALVTKEPAPRAVWVLPPRGRESSNWVAPRPSTSPAQVASSGS
jgi:hypothetical protein